MGKKRRKKRAAGILSGADSCPMVEPDSKGRFGLSLGRVGWVLDRRAEKRCSSPDGLGGEVVVSVVRFTGD